MEAAALVSTPHFMPAIQAFMVIIKQGQMDGGVSSKRSKNTEWRSLVYCCKCCHLPVSSATAGVYACSVQENILHRSPCLSCRLSLNVYEALGTVYKKFIGSVGRPASLMSNVGVFFPFFPSCYAMTPPVSHVFEQMGCSRGSRGGGNVCSESLPHFINIQVNM